jgi:hypothetical protein
MGVQTNVGQLFPAEARGNNFDDCQYGIMAVLAGISSIHILLPQSKMG